MTPEQLKIREQEKKIGRIELENDTLKKTMALLMSDSLSNFERVEQADRVVRRQLSKMLELNDGQKHEFSRTRMVEILDEEIAKRSSIK